MLLRLFFLLFNTRPNVTFLSAFERENTEGQAKRSTLGRLTNDDLPREVLFTCDTI